MDLISKEAFDLIVREEVSSEAVYRKRYTRPEWPGVQSGVTIGIGYDVGYSTPSRLRADWKGRIPDSMIEALIPACGVRGPAAAALTRELKSKVVVPWEAAIAEFKEVEIPRWVAKVRAVLPNDEQLSPNGLGALVSLAYNRGPSFNNSGARYAEMRAIKACMASGRFSGIPAQFRSMKRLWPNVKGLRDRREREAIMFEKSLQEKPPAPVPTPDPETPIPPSMDIPDDSPLNEDTPDTKPVIKSKSIWTSILGILTMIAGAIQQVMSSVGDVVTDWKFWVFILVACMFAYIIWERNGKPDISGWFRSE